MKQWVKNRKEIVLLVAVFLALNVVFLFVTPEQIVQYVGAYNTYIAIFVIASISGISSFTGGVLYVSIAAFAAGGASPWLLGLIGGLGIAVGDSIIFYLFRYSSKSLPAQWQVKVAKVKVKVEHLPRPIQYTLIYMYLSFAPLPTDFLLFLLAILRFKFVQVLPLIILGGMTIATITALVGAQIPF